MSSSSLGASLGEAALHAAVGTGLSQLESTFSTVEANVLRAARNGFHKTAVPMTGVWHMDKHNQKLVAQDLEREDLTLLEVRRTGAESVEYIVSWGREQKPTKSKSEHGHRSKRSKSKKSKSDGKKRRPTILVTNGTSDVARATSAALLHRRRFHVRVAISDYYEAEDVYAALPDVRFADVDSRSSRSIARAMKGVTGVVLVPPRSSDRVAVVTRYVNAAVESGVQQLTLISFIGVDDAPDHPFLQQVADMEKVVRASGLSWVVLRTSHFMWSQSFLEHLDHDQLRVPIFGGAVSGVAVEEVGECAAKTMTTKAFGEEVFGLTGPEAVTGDQMAQALGKQLRRSVYYAPPDAAALRDEVLEAGRSSEDADAYVSLWQMFDQGFGASVHPGVREILSRDPLSFARWLRHTPAPSLNAGVGGSVDAPFRVDGDEDDMAQFEAYRRRKQARKGASKSGGNAVTASEMQQLEQEGGVSSPRAYRLAKQSMRDRRHAERVADPERMYAAQKRAARRQQGLDAASGQTAAGDAMVTTATAPAHVSVAPKQAPVPAPLARRKGKLSRTMPGRLLQAANTWTTSTAFKYKKGGMWLSTSWSDYLSQVRGVAKALVAHGLRSQQKVVLVLGSRPEYSMFALGTMAVGAVAVHTYDSTDAEELAFVLQQTRSPLVLLEDETTFARLEPYLGRLSHLRHMVLASGSVGHKLCSGWDEFLSVGAGVQPSTLNERTQAIHSDDLAAIYYTGRGSGFAPVGCMLSHRNLTFTTDLIAELLDVDGSDTLVAHLPLSNIMEQLFTIYLPLSTGLQCYYADGMGHLHANLREVQPTLLFSSPLLWDRFESTLQATIGTADVAALPRATKTKLLAFLGCSNLRRALTGTAPLPRHVSDFFAGLGVTLYEAYGKAACSGFITWASPSRSKPGTVGRPHPKVSVKLGPNAEILVKGYNTFLGYYKNAPETEASIDAMGWFHTGDLGAFDEDGFLVLKATKSDIIKMRSGDLITPIPIENALKACPLVSQACVVGEGRDALVALLTLNSNAIVALARGHGRTPEQVRADAHSIVAEHVTLVNEQLSTRDQVTNFTLLEDDFSVIDGEVTPTFKLNRGLIEDKYAGQVNLMYAE